mmetsp:Transcript_28733/g.85681  ORF Transcript_28733/g.85681 Transcript_28733/m.85681 type:complete len:288 (+) Transcript_28733:365-1228(+)
MLLSVHCPSTMVRRLRRCRTPRLGAVPFRRRAHGRLGDGRRWTAARESLESHLQRAASQRAAYRGERQREGRMATASRTAWPCRHAAPGDQPCGSPRDPRRRSNRQQQQQQQQQQRQRQRQQRRGRVWTAPGRRARRGLGGGGGSPCPRTRGALPRTHRRAPPATEALTQARSESTLCRAPKPAATAAPPLSAASTTASTAASATAPSTCACVATAAATTARSTGAPSRTTSWSSSAQRRRRSRASRLRSPRRAARLATACCSGETCCSGGRSRPQSLPLAAAAAER